MPHVVEKHQDHLRESAEDQMDRDPVWMRPWQATIREQRVEWDEQRRLPISPEAFRFAGRERRELSSGRWDPRRAKRADALRQYPDRRRPARTESNLRYLQDRSSDCRSRCTPCTTDVSSTERSGPRRHRATLS